MLHKKIILAEDEPTIAENIKILLNSEGYEVSTITNGQAVLQEIDRLKNADLLILDVMMPHINGFDVCKKIREKNIDIPIIFLTALNDMNDKIKGLQLGGDDYLTKPFHSEELLLRIRNLLKRTSGKKKKIKIGNCIIDFSSYEAICNGRKYELKQKELQLLELLYKKANEVVSRDEILDYVWGEDVYPTPRTVDNFIVNLRKILEEDSRNPRYLQSVRGVGYKLVIDI